MLPKPTELPAPGAPEQGKFPLDYGSIYFKMHRADADAEFIRARMSVDKKNIVKHALQTWGLEKPGVLIRVCGTLPGTQSLGMLDNHGDFLSSMYGVLSAATVARAWLFSTGLDFGIASAMGTTLGRDRHHCNCPLIGFTEWDVVQGSEQLLKAAGGEKAAPGSKRVYTDGKPDDDMSTVSLQANHSHYVLVGGEGDEAYTAPDPNQTKRQLLLGARTRAFNFAHDFEIAMATHEGRQVPRLLVVLCGDETTLAEVLNYCRKGGGLIVFVTATGGLAAAMGRYAFTGQVPSEWAEYESMFTELRELNKARLDFLAAQAVSNPSGIESNVKPQLFDSNDETTQFPLFVFSLKRGKEDTSNTLLDAIMAQHREPRVKVCTAVEWDDAPRLSQIFTTMVPAWLEDRIDTLREATQLALEQEKAACIKVLVGFAAPVTNIDMLALYDKLYDEKDAPRFPMFVGNKMPTLARSERRENSPKRNSRASANLDEPTGTVVASTPRGTPVKSTFQTKSKMQLQAASRASGAALMAEAYEGGGGSGYLKLEEADPVYDYYPKEVWQMLELVVPGLCKYWRETLEQHALKEAEGGDGDAEDLQSGGKLGPRWIDIYVWAVLLGNSELATMLLPACQEPMRAAVIGARIFNDMAARLPLNAVELKAAAVEQEEWALGLLDLCDNFQQARRMLITKSTQWSRPVLHLALQSGLRNFCAHHYCQSLCDEWIRGNNRAPGQGPKGVLSRTASGSTIGILGFALCPLTSVWGEGMLEWSVPEGKAKPADPNPPVHYFYKIPRVKSTLRLSWHLCFTLFMSYAALQAKPRGFDDDTHGSFNAFHSGNGIDKWYIHLICIVWTLSLILDEWYKYVQDVATFQADFWNSYDYCTLSLTMGALALRLISLTYAMEMLSFALLLIWCRTFKYLTSNQSIGVLIIMIMNMFQDILLWGLVSGIFLVAFTVAFVSISDPDMVSDDVDMPMAMPVWAMLGSFDNIEVDGWNPRVGQAMLWLYVIVSNVVLVNLLIAMMGDTYGVIKEKADEEWKFGRLLSVVEATERMSPVPPPLNLPLTLGLFVHKYFGVGSSDSVGSSSEEPPPAAVAEAQAKKRVIARKLILALRAKEVKDGGESVVGRLESLATDMKQMEESLAEVQLRLGDESNNPVTGGKITPTLTPMPSNRGPAWAA